MVAEIVLVVGGKIAFALDIVSSDFVKSEGVAEIPDIGADGSVVGLKLLVVKCRRHTAGRVQVGDVVDQEITETFHQRHVAYPILSLDIPDNQQMTPATSTCRCVGRL